VFRPTLLSHRFSRFTFLSSVPDLGVTLDSSFTFPNHISNLTRSSYCHLRRFRGQLGLSECLSPPLSLPLSSTHLSVLELIIVTLYSMASLKFDYLLFRLSSMPTPDQLLVFPVSLTSLLWHNNFTTRIEFKVLFLVLKSQLGSAPTYLCDHMRLPIFSSSLRPRRSSQRRDLLMPRLRTPMAHTRSFASTGPSIWNRLHPPIRSFILSAPLSASSLFLALSRTFFLEMKCTESASV